MRAIPRAVSETGRTTGIQARGLIHHEDGRESQINISVSATVRSIGAGAIDLRWELDGTTLDGGELIWVVTTNKGWAHLRGEAWPPGTAVRLPFRADLFSAAASGSTGPDRIAIRLYAMGVDPNVARPSQKVLGWLERGSIALSGPTS